MHIVLDLLTVILYDKISCSNVFRILIKKNSSFLYFYNKPYHQRNEKAKHGRAKDFTYIYTHKLYVFGKYSIRCEFSYFIMVMIASFILQATAR